MKAKILIPLAGLALFCACKGVNSSKSTDSTSIESGSEKSINSQNVITQTTPKLVKTADVRFKVKNVQEASEKIAALTVSMNGTVIHHVISSTLGNSVDVKKNDDSLVRITVFNKTAEMTVKIPPY